MKTLRILWARNSALLVLAIVVALLAKPATGQPPEQAKAGERVDVLIGFTDVPGPAEHAIVRAQGGQIRRSFWLVPAVAASIPEPAWKALEKHPRVTVVERDGTFHLIGEAVPLEVAGPETAGDGTDAELDNTWGVKRIGAGETHAAGYQGGGVRVAIVDSGVDYMHPDLAHAFSGLDQNQEPLLGYNFVNGNDNPMDDNGHGTHVAGTVAAARDGVGVVGVAPQVELYALKVLSATGSGSFSDVIAALQWCVDNHVDVANHSYGSSGDPGVNVRNAFQNSYEFGVLHVAAAGNSGNTPGNRDTVGYPARYDSVIAVAATGTNDKRASWSSTGPDVELSAPGVSINSTLPGRGYGTKSGTSMASPHVAGTAALVIAVGSAGVEDVRWVLQETATDLGNPYHYGYGLVDAYLAPASVQPPGPPEPAVIVTLDIEIDEEETTAILFATVTDENGDPITGLAEEAFVTEVVDAALEVTFSETVTFEETGNPGTYSGTLGVSDFPDGEYEVTVTVTDALRELSGLATASFTIGALEIAPAVSVDSIDYRTDGGRLKDKDLYIDTLVDGSDGPVGGASVSIALYRNDALYASGTGTTGSNGTLTFKLVNVPSGTYTTVVTDVQAEGLEWDGDTPTNSFVK